MSENSAFERRQIAQIVGTSYALIRNWSGGKTFEIVPGVKAPTERGAAKLYTLAQVYFMAITISLRRQGMDPDSVKALIRLLKPDWFRKEKRGFVIFGRSSRGKMKVTHTTVGLRGEPILTLLNRSADNVGGWLDLRGLLDRIDRTIANSSSRRLPIQ